MKIVAFISNVILFVFTCILLLFEGTSGEAVYIILSLLMLLVPVLNMVVISASWGWFGIGNKSEASLQQKKAGSLFPVFPLLKLVVVILDLPLIGFPLWILVKQNPHPEDPVIAAFALLVIITPIISLIAILNSKTKKFENMKRTLIIIGSGLLMLLFCFIIAIRIWIGLDIRGNINIAKKQYSGIAEDALISYLLDTINSPHNRSQVAIWTLGQIRSEKALPVLKRLYKNDPEGKTCKGKHDLVLCQYELYKAIDCLEHNYWWASHPGLNK